MQTAQHEHQAAPTRQWRHERQRILRKRLQQRRIVGDQPMQTGRELRRIPDGSAVIMHLLRSAIGAKPEHMRALASFGLLANDYSGKRRGPSSGHVGRAVCHTWRANWASRRTQTLTRYMYVDPGDAVLAELDARASSEGNSVKVERFETSSHEPAAVLIDEGRRVRIESQPDGFGMMWPTTLDVVAAIDRALSVLPEPGSGDDAVVTSDETSLTVPVSELLPTLAARAHRVSLVELDIGPAALVWAESSNGSGPHRRMSFGDDYYVRKQVEVLLSRTADLASKLALEHVLALADETLKSQHAPSA